MNWFPSLAPVKGFARFIITEAPTLRIVPEDLWRAAHERLDRTRQTYLRSTGGKLCGRPEAGLESKNLLAGFVTCGVCGGSMHAIKRTSKRGRPVRYYVCNGWRVNGSCDNALSLPMTALDTKILDTLKADVLTAEIVEVVVTRTIELARLEPDEHAEKRLRLTDDAERLATEIQRLTEESSRAARWRHSSPRSRTAGASGRMPWPGSSTSTGSAARRNGATASATSCALDSPTGAACSAGSRRSRGRSSAGYSWAGSCSRPTLRRAPTPCKAARAMGVCWRG